MGNNAIDCITSYKILGVFIDSDVMWNSQAEYIFKKVKLRVLHRADVKHANMLKV